MDTSKATIKAAFKVRRAQLSLSQDDLAALTGIDRSEICRIEGGKKAPEAKITLLASALQWSETKLRRLLRQAAPEIAIEANASRSASGEAA